MKEREREEGRKIEKARKNRKKDKTLQEMVRRKRVKIDKEQI